MTNFAPKEKIIVEWAAEAFLSLNYEVQRENQDYQEFTVYEYFTPRIQKKESAVNQEYMDLIDTKLKSK